MKWWQMNNLNLLSGWNLQRLLPVWLFSLGGDRRVFNTRKDQLKRGIVYFAKSSNKAVLQMEQSPNSILEEI